MDVPDPLTEGMCASVCPERRHSTTGSRWEFRRGFHPPGRELHPGTGQIHSTGGFRMDLQGELGRKSRFGQDLGVTAEREELP